jgi:hypothetical protein
MELIESALGVTDSMAPRSAEFEQKADFILTWQSG